MSVQVSVVIAGLWYRIVAKAQFAQSPRSTLDSEERPLVLFGYAHPCTDKRRAAIQVYFNIKDAAVVLAYQVARHASVW